MLLLAAISLLDPEDKFHLRTPTWNTVLSLVMFLILGIGLTWLLTRLLRGVLGRHFGPHAQQVATKIIITLAALILVGTVMAELGLDLTALFLTGGIATIAIGFAAQTSLSNLICGLFLLGERPFAVGDLVRVKGNFGVVHAIDMLSVKIRTLDNLFVRVPNETMIKEELTNFSRFPIRRMDFDLRVAFGTDLEKFFAIVRELANDNPHCLDEPEPLLLVKEYTETALVVLVAIWFEKSKYVDLRNSFLTALSSRLEKEHIDVPDPRVAIWSAADENAPPRP